MRKCGYEDRHKRMFLSGLGQRKRRRFPPETASPETASPELRICDAPVGAEGAGRSGSPHKAGLQVEYVFV